MGDIQQSLNELYAPLCNKEYVKEKVDANKLEVVFEELDGPFLIKSNSEYEQSDQRVMIVGQENNGWIGAYGEFLNKKSMEEALRLYESFNYDQSYTSTFFQWMAKIADSLVTNYEASPKQVIWSNLFKFNQGLNPQMIYSELKKDALSLQGETFSQEVEILNPNVVMFLTGPYYDSILNKFFPGLEFIPIDGHPTRQLAQLKHEKLPEFSFRTYHPGYLQRSLGKTGYCIPAIIKLVTGNDESLKYGQVTERELGDDKQITIDRIEMGTGWVCFQGGETRPSPDQLSLFLNDALANWLRNNSEFKVRTILPIVVEGNTVAINVWFD